MTHVHTITEALLCERCYSMADQLVTAEQARVLRGVEKNLQDAMELMKEFLGE